MKKGILIVLVVSILVLTFAFVACNSKSYDYSNGYQPENGEYIDKEISENAEILGTQERKIIYTANSTISVDNVEESVDSIRALLIDGEWIERSQTSESSAQIVLRIKSNRLNGFMEKLSEIGNVNISTVSSEDVSLSYYDTTLRKQTLENEYARLNELLKSADNISDILTINKRLAEIDSELQKLQNKLNTYDSLIEYSRVTVTVYQKGEEPKKATFGDKVGTAYGVNGKIIEGLAIFLIAVLPYLAFAALLTVSIILIRKHVKKKKQSAHTNEQPKDGNNVVALKNDDENK